MKMKTIIFLTIISTAICFTSCAGADYEPSAFGDLAVVEMKDNKSFSGELLCIDDSCIYLIIQNKIYAISAKSTDKIIIDKYSDRSWILGVLLLEFVPSIVISSLVASNDGNFGLALGLTIIPSIVSAILFETSTPKSNYNEVNSKETKADLYKFTRYPGGITTSQLNDLLNNYGQKECIYVK
jgi:hypothetical protein